MRFLLVEDNENLAAAVVARLSMDGHVVDHAPDLDTADGFMDVAEFDLILLDIMLPDGDGRRFLERQRARANETPIIVLTARSEVSDRVGVLDLGADDYITKPFDFSELEARCRAVLRRRGGGRQTLVTHGNLSFDPLSGELTVADRKVTLRTKELRLLEVFLAAEGRILSKAKLVDRLFTHDEDVSENAIEVYVGRLRRHLDGSPVSIVTVRGSGYRLVSE